jgi:hypothetical protein
MRPDAVLTALPSKPKRGTPGRRPLRGRLLPKPQALARNGRVSWQTCSAFLYGKRQTIYFKTLDAQRYRACGTRLLRVIVVRVDAGRSPVRIFFCTDASLSIVDILETYAGRWAIEVCFRDLKQLLGFADSSARKREAAERTAPFVGYIYTTLVLWFAQHAWQSSVALPPVRPWFPHKRGLCFADVLRAAQRTLLHLDVLDPARSIDDLRRSTARSRDALPASRKKTANSKAHPASEGRIRPKPESEAGAGTRAPALRRRRAAGRVAPLRVRKPATISRGNVVFHAESLKPEVCTGETPRARLLIRNARRPFPSFRDLTNECSPLSARRIAEEKIRVCIEYESDRASPERSFVPCCPESCCCHDSRALRRQPGASSSNSRALER